MSDQFTRAFVADMFRNVDLADFAARVVQDALTAARPAHWLRRAAEFEAARPRPGDYHGQATPDEIAALDDRLALIAEQCRLHADLLRQCAP